MTIQRWRPRRGLMPWRPLESMEEMERRFEDLGGKIHAYRVKVKLSFKCEE